jgi:hypothetical protein
MSRLQSLGFGKAGPRACARPCSADLKWPSGHGVRVGVVSPVISGGEFLFTGDTVFLYSTGCKPPLVDPLSQSGKRCARIAFSREGRLFSSDGPLRASGNEIKVPERRGLATSRICEAWHQPHKLAKQFFWPRTGNSQGPPVSAASFTHPDGRHHSAAAHNARARRHAATAPSAMHHPRSIR